MTRRGVRRRAARRGGRRARRRARRGPARRAAPPPVRHHAPRHHRARASRCGTACRPTLHGLDRSRHRLLEEDGALIVELDVHGAAAPQVLGAILAAGVDGRRASGARRSGRSTPRSRQPGRDPRALRRPAARSPASRSCDRPAPVSARVGTASSAQRHRLVGRRPGRAALGDGGLRPRAGRAVDRERRADAGSGACSAWRIPTTAATRGAAERIAELTEARELLLDGRAGGRRRVDRSRRDAVGAAVSVESAAWRQTPVHVTVTGAAGQIGYALLFRIASGQLLGPDQPVVLRLLEIEPAMQALDGVVMELDDCAFPLLAGIEATSRPRRRAFDGTQLGAARRLDPAQGRHGARRPAQRQRRDLQAAGPGDQRARGRRRPRARRRQPVQHQLPDRAQQRARRSGRPLVRDDPPRREPRARPSSRRRPACRSPTVTQRHDLGQPLGDAVPRLRQRARSAASPRPT